MGMFDKFAKTASKSSSKVSSTEIPQTTAFLQALVNEGIRLSYTGLALAARELGENTSGQMPGQRGAALVKELPLELQPHVCRGGKSLGSYAKGMTWATEVPENLRSRPALDTIEDVQGAIEVWQAALADEA